MTVYLDVVFFENLFMNYIILFATGYIMKLRMKQLKIVLASITGSLYAIFSYMQGLLLFSNVIVKIMLSIAMVLLAFNPKKIKIFFKEIILFYLVSFVFGGCALSLLYFIKPQNILIRNGVFVGRYPVQIALLGGIVGFVIMQMAFKNVKNRINKKDIFAELTIFWNEKKVKLKALIDTGNMLKEPITGLPVVVVYKNELYQVFSKDILDNTEDIINGKLSEEIFLKEQDLISKFRMIPFTSLGKQNGLLLGIKVEKVQIYFDETEKMINEVIIGLSDKPISKNGEYTALLGLDILERSEKSEFASKA